MHDKQPGTSQQQGIDHMTRRALLGACAAGLLAGCAADPKPAATQPSASPESLKPTSSSPESKASKERYPIHKVTATEFWIGEKASPDNGGISNEQTAWDSDPVTTFGGVDDPKHPPANIRHNQYYFALPVNEFNEQGLIPGTREKSPWANEPVGRGESLFKGRWVEVSADGAPTIYAQWLDTGPCATTECNDLDYVFGDAAPQNQFNQRAGLDLSPSAMAALRGSGSIVVTWRFVDNRDVPDGPWRQHPPITNKTNW